MGSTVSRVGWGGGWGGSIISFPYTLTVFNLPVFCNVHHCSELNAPVSVYYVVECLLTWWSNVQSSGSLVLTWFSPGALMSSSSPGSSVTSSGGNRATIISYLQRAVLSVSGSSSSLPGAPPPVLGPMTRSLPHASIQAVVRKLNNLQNKQQFYFN